MTDLSLVRDLAKRINLEPSIPRIIHQTYKTRDLPVSWQQTPSSWIKHHPSWKYVFWDDEDCRRLVADKFPDFLSIFDGYQYPIQRADAIRYMILYTFGGIYIDMDIAAKKPIDDLFYKDADVYLLTTPNGGIITNCLMASKPGMRFWLHVLDLMREHVSDPSSLWLTKHLIVMNTTGPSMLQIAYDTWVQNSSCRISFLPQSYLFPEQCGVCAIKPCTTRESYITVLPGSSWCEVDTQIMTLLYCHYKEILLLIVLGILLLYIRAYFPD